MNARIATVVFPARDLAAGIAAWRTVLGVEPAWVGDDFAVFRTGDLEIGLTAAQWIGEPLVMLATDDIDKDRRALIDAGATGLGEVADGSLAELGTAPIANGDPETGIVDAPGARLAVVRLANGNHVGLRQAQELRW
jgi:catechol 2,3-dioxygenase-like lactoylglutathione lyase family enzyme